MILPQNKTTHFKLITLYLLTLFGICPLYLSADKLQGITFRWILLFLLTASTLVAYILLLLKRKAVCRKRFHQTDTCALVILLLSFGKILVGIFSGRGGYELPLLAVVSIFSYFLLSVQKEGADRLFKVSYLDLFLAASAIIYVVLLARLFAFPGLHAPVGILVEDQATMTAFLALGAVIGTLQYCSNRKSVKDRVYLPVAAAGFFLLFMQQDILSILLLGSLFLLIPLIFRPTAELIKRDLVMAFVFFFTLSNMPLISTYTGLLKAETEFDLMNSMYLDLVMAGVGVMVFSYWERVPKNIPPDAIIMKRLRKAFAFSASIGAVLLAAVLCIGPADTAETGSGIRLINGLAGSLRTKLAQVDGTFGQALHEYGLAGWLLTAAAFTLLLMRIKKQYVHTNRSALLTAVGLMFLAQSFFYKQQVVTTPIYVVLVTFALFQDKNKEERYEKAREQEMEEGAAADGGGDDAVGEHGMCQPDGAAGGTDGSGGRDDQRLCDGD